MRTTRFCLTLAVAAALVMVVAAPSVFGQAKPLQDFPGAKDTTLFTRMPGFVLISPSAIVERSFDRYEFYVTTNKVRERKPIEGHVVTYKYILDKAAAPTPSNIEIMRNYQAAAARLGGKVLHEDTGLTTILIAKDGKETWIEVNPIPNGYEVHAHDSGPPGDGAEGRGRRCGLQGRPGRDRPRGSAGDLLRHGEGRDQARVGRRAQGSGEAAAGRPRSQGLGGGPHGQHRRGGGERHPVAGARRGGREGTGRDGHPRCSPVGPRRRTVRAGGREQERCRSREEPTSGVGGESSRTYFNPLAFSSGSTLASLPRNALYAAIASTVPPSSSTLRKAFAVAGSNRLPFSTNAWNASLS